MKIETFITEVTIVPAIVTGGEQLQPSYRDINPMQQVPAFVDDKGNCISQSAAIMEYLEEVHTNKPLLPPSNEPLRRAQVRMLVETIAGGIQPLQNLSVNRKHSDDQGEQNAWAKYWIEHGFDGLEAMLKQTAGMYCVGDQVTLADACLVPQVANAERFKVDLSKYSLIVRINDALKQLQEFQAAAPENQPDYPKN